MEPPGWPEDSHPSDSGGASEARPAPSTMARSSLGQLVSAMGSAVFGSLVKHCTCPLGSFSSHSGSARQGGRGGSRTFLSSTQVCYFPLNSHQLSNQKHKSPGDLTFSSSPAGRQNFK